MIWSASTDPNWSRSVARSPVAHGMRGRGCWLAPPLASRPSGSAIALFLSAASTPAAFAVTGNSDGTVSVVLHRIVGIKGANEKLAALGVRAKFVQVVAGCRAALPPAAVANLKTPDQVLIHAGRQTRIDPRKIPAGRTLVIVSWIRGGNVRTIQLGPAAKAAPNCIAGPAPRALRFAWAVAHGCRVHVAGAPNAISCADPAKAGRSRTRPAAASRSTRVRAPERAAHPPGTAVRSRGTAVRLPGTAVRSRGTAARLPGTAVRSRGTAARPPGTAARRAHIRQPSR